MANRILLGKNVNSNHGHSSSSAGFGLYISRASKNVLTCTADELIFNTDNGSSTDVSRVVGMFQLAPIDTSNNTTTTTNVSANSTATISVSSVNFGLSLGFIGYGNTSISSGSGSGVAEYENNFSAQTITIRNTTSNSLQVKSFLAPRYTSNAFF